MNHKLWVLSEERSAIDIISKDPEDYNCTCDDLFKRLRKNHRDYDLDWIMCFKCGRVWVRKNK